MSVVREDGFRWDGVPVRSYDGDGATHRGVSRQVLLGDAPGEEPLAFVTRYFEIEPGGHTALEHHDHPHAVVVLRGCGSVLLDADRNPIAPFDCVYVGPRVRHEFRADRGETLGFLCVVDRIRDRPVREPNPPAPAPDTGS